ncbi:hypothetical protein GCM10007049_30870 [Echinicola pacifica]|uniref:Uncharacterized protein n=1 Tax=Echinicola pacifica TaxID=346377 RepID=A0A918Q8W7_9BACT|nr:hypothetical protein [Echinicola pacifica]GGZ35271.1 hypothetical protein GCM10007049_30870 [Echinicola pacifica]
MNIIELIPYLKNLHKAESVSQVFLPDIEFDLVELYVKDKLALDSEVVFLDADSIPNELKIELDGVLHENLFPLYLAQEMVEEYVKTYNDELSDIEIAKRLLEYRINDA